MDIITYPCQNPNQWMPVRRAPGGFHVLRHPSDYPAKPYRRWDQRLYHPLTQRMCAYLCACMCVCNKVMHHETFMSPIFCILRPAYEAQTKSYIAVDTPCAFKWKKGLMQSIIWSGSVPVIFVYTIQGTCHHIVRLPQFESIDKEYGQMSLTNLQGTMMWPQDKSQQNRVLACKYTVGNYVCYWDINSSSPRQNGRHFTYDIFKCIFVNEKFCILIRISPKFVPKGPIDNKSASVQVMAWCRTGEKPLPEPMLTQFTDAYMGHLGRWVDSIFSRQLHGRQSILLI